MADVQLTVPKNDLLAQLSSQVAEGKRLVASRDISGDHQEFERDYFAWEDFNIALLQQAFTSTGGWLTVTPLSEYRRITTPVVTIHFRRTDGVPMDRLKEVTTDIEEKCRYMEALAGRLDLYLPRSGATSGSNTSTEAIFLVHGHNLLLRENVRRFVENLTGRQVIVLDEQPNLGRDILGKLLDKAYDAAFAVVLLTGDDEGYIAGSASTPQLRARQNVILELGLFLGLLGRDRVAALYQDGVEIPSDYSGILYTKIDDGGWQLKLARELSAAGIPVDMNKLI